MKNAARSTSLTIEAAQALCSISFQAGRGNFSTYKYPRLRMQIREILVRRLIFSGMMIGSGRKAKAKSVKALIAACC